MTQAFDNSAAAPDQASQLGLELGGIVPRMAPDTYFSHADIDLDKYDNIIVLFSGGKDSIASLLHLIDQGVDMNRVELWHHEVDGRGDNFMDWPFMTDYNKKFATAFDLPIYFSWLDGGFKGEMLKENDYSKPHFVETPDGLIKLERDTTRAKPNTRLKFPQVSANLQTRWCSAVLKVDVGRRALNNQDRFNGKSILCVSGERRQESANRSKYNQLEPHACDRRNGRMARLVDAYRPVLDWSEQEVWDILKRHNVSPPLPYRLGFPRSSCMKCIFNDKVIWSTMQAYFPGSLDEIAGYEKKFGTTISRDQINVLDLANTAEPMEITDTEALRHALSTTYELPIFTTQEEWTLPAGAFGRTGCGP